MATRTNRETDRQRERVRERVREREREKDTHTHTHTHTHKGFAHMCWFFCFLLAERSRKADRTGHALVSSGLLHIIWCADRGISFFSVEDEDSTVGARL